MGAAYFVRGRGERWAVIRLHPDDREEVIAEGLSKEAAIERCCALLEDIARGAAAVDDESVVEDIAPKRRPRQLTLKF